MRTLLPLTLAFFVLLAPAVAQDSHQVQPNQTLYSIARLYNVSVDQLRAWNNLGDGVAIRVGQTLVVKPAARAGTVNPGLNPFLYTVRTTDTLTGLSIKFGTSVDLLKRLNDLGDEGLYVGQRLFIRRPVGLTFYVVQPGDSLKHLSTLFDIAPADLKAINQLTGDALVPGKTLRVFKPAEVPLTHTVAAIDTPAGVAALYGLTVADLQRLNGADALALKAGQVLKLRSYASASTSVLASPVRTRDVSFPDETPVAAPPAASGSRSYVVQKGDSLLKITRNLGIRLDDLLAWNSLNADAVLHVGQSLDLGPGTTAVPASLVAQPLLPKAKGDISFPDDPVTPVAPVVGNLPAFRDEDQAKIHWDSYVVLDKDIPVFEWNNDYYYWTHPGEVSQPNRGYFENSWPSPLDAYQKAKQLQNRFDKLVGAQPSLSSLLKGTTVVIDPGHGGVDPGAIVKAEDDQGKDVYLTEHEYVYDISLRVYALLKRHGANVVLTVLAPNHLIRDTKPANNTLINEKNQVYNDLAVNQGDDADAWPNGSPKGLERRVAIADKAFRNVAAGHRVFLSLHADSNPTSPLGTGVFALETKEGNVDAKSLAFARTLVPYLGTDAYARTQNLAVLRGNDADYKVLVEVHNLADPEQSQAMRAGSSRQLSAQKIVRGLLEALGK